MAVVVTAKEDPVTIFPEARKRFEAGDRWQIRIECTSNGSSKKWICTGGPGWTTRRSWGKIGGHRQHKLEPAWSFYQAVDAALDKVWHKDYHKVDCDQPKSMLPVVEETPQHSDSEAQSIMAAVGSVGQTTTTNKNASGYLSDSRRAKIKALWAKKNGQTAAKAKPEAKPVVTLPKTGDINVRFTMLEMDSPKPSPLKEETDINPRFAYLEFD